MESALVGDADASTYLIILGVLSIVNAILIISVFLCGVLAVDTENGWFAALACVSIILSIISALFGIAWFIIGAIILFNDNIECINEGSATVVFALVMWIISAYQIIVGCCSSSKRNQEQE
jgi:hypothetical protein